MSKHYRCAVAVLALSQLTLVACGGKDSRNMTEPTTGVATSREANLDAWSEPVSLGSLINTSYAEQQPALSKDGLSLYFMSNRPENPNDAVLDNNIWVSHRACLDCPWGEPVELPAGVNSASNDAQPSFSRDEHWLFFVTGRVASQANDIWAAYRDDVHDDFAWQAPAPLIGGVNSPAAEGGPAYFENAEGGAPQLFFTSNKQNPTVALATDIYVSEQLPDGSWGPALPVTELNTAAADQKPTVTPNGLEIYFWSDRDAGRPPAGASFIWHATRSSTTAPWSAPLLVEDPINNQSSTQPFIHVHGRAETLFIVRNVGTADHSNLDIFSATRTRPAGPN